MNGAVRKRLRIARLVVFCLSTALLLRQLADNAGGGESYDAALSIATAGKKTAAPAETEAAKGEWVPETVTGDENMDVIAAIDIGALQEVNPDVIGWIWIPDSKVNYPIVQGSDNDYYLKHTWDKQENSVGSIFLEHRNTADFGDYNTILYGHNMNDGSMFANIKRYSTEWYWERHPYIYIATETGHYRYEVFSGYESSTEGTAYGLSFHQPETKVNFLKTAIQKSTADTGVRPELTDRVLTLSTCSGVGYANRWVVHARLKMVKVE